MLLQSSCLNILSRLTHKVCVSTQWNLSILFIRNSISRSGLLFWLKVRYRLLRPYQKPRLIDFRCLSGSLILFLCTALTLIFLLSIFRSSWMPHFWHSFKWWIRPWLIIIKRVRSHEYYILLITVIVTWTFHFKIKMYNKFLLWIIKYI